MELCNSFDSIMVLLIKEVCTKIIKSAGIPGTDSGLGGGGGGTWGYIVQEYRILVYTLQNTEHASHIYGIYITNIEQTLQDYWIQQLYSQYWVTL